MTLFFAVMTPFVGAATLAALALLAPSAHLPFAGETLIQQQDMTRGNAPGSVRFSKPPRAADMPPAP